jgi:hypothetical protein
VQSRHNKQWVCQTTCQDHCGQCFGLLPAAFLAQLNVHQGLYHAVASAVGASSISDAAAQPDGPSADSSSPGVANSAAAAARNAAPLAEGAAARRGGTAEPLPPAAQRVGQLLLQDFEANGVHLQGDAQARFLAASAREQMLCLQFGGSRGWQPRVCTASSVRHPSTLKCFQPASGHWHNAIQQAHWSTPLQSSHQLSTITAWGAGHNMADPAKYGRIAVPIKSRGGALDALPPNARVAARREGKLLRVPTHEQLLPELLTHLPDHTLRRQVVPAAPQ